MQTRYTAKTGSYKRLLGTVHNEAFFRGLCYHIPLNFENLPCSKYSFVNVLYKEIKYTYLIFEDFELNGNGPCR